MGHYQIEGEFMSRNIFPTRPICLINSYSLNANFRDFTHPSTLKTPQETLSFGYHIIFLRFKVVLGAQGTVPWAPNVVL